MINIFDPNSSVTLGCKMSEIRQKLNEAHEVTAPEDKSKASQVAKRAIANLKELALENEGFWGRLFRIILKAFGYITEYQRVLNEIEKYESEANALSEDAVAELEKLAVKKIKQQLRIEQSVVQIVKDFDEIDAAVINLKDRADRVSGLTDDYLELQKDIGQYQSYLKQLEGSLQKFNQIYQEDIEGFKNIPALWGKHAQATNTLAEISKQLTDMVIPNIQFNPVSNSTAIVEAQPGGISQGGNTCYLASACQAINQVTEYRNLFNPKKNPLRKRYGESPEKFEERKLIQRRAFYVLERIAKGQDVKGSEINTLREACFNHAPKGKKIIKSLTGTADSMEILGRLLGVMDYKDPQVTFSSQTVIDESQYEIVPDIYYDKPKDAWVKRDPIHYKTLEETKKIKKELSNLTFCAYSHLNETVSMQTLQNEFFAMEPLADGTTVKHVTENGDVIYRKYKNVQVKKTIDMNNLPKVLRILVQQLDGQRATIKQPEFFYPSGKPGIGPKYVLKSIVEHMPGHYVAHLNTSQGLVTANDGWVHKTSSSSIPGYGYIYVMEAAGKVQ